MEAFSNGGFVLGVATVMSEAAKRQVWSVPRDRFD